jgi:FKBP-type peptidyl-prolyl cis-trans isomerase
MKSTKIVPFILMAVSVAVLFTACNMGEYKGFKKTSSGIYYKVTSTDNQDTTRIAVGSIINLDLKYGLKDSVLFDTKSRPGDMRFPMPESKYEGDFYEALRLFNQGDSGTFIIKAGPFFMKTVGQPSVPEGMTEETDMYFNFYIKKVQTQAEVDAEEAAKSEALRQQEAGLISNYIAQKNITVQPDENGIYYIEKVKGKGKSPLKDDYATVHFVVYKLDGEKLFSTYESNNEPLDFQIGGRFENPGFQKAVEKMATGGKCEALVPSAMAFGAQGAGQIVPPFTPLFYEIELTGIMSKEQFDKKQADIEAKKQAEAAMKEQQESIDLQKYLKDNNIQGVTKPSGLIYVETLAGTGKSPVSGKNVKVHYTGKLLDGTTFDSSVGKEPLEFPIGQGQVIPGWDEGISLMKEGGKATLIIPSKLGYGSRGAGGVIPPFASLVFDVELVEVAE